jgi:hypothetical protein
MYAQTATIAHPSPSLDTMGLAARRAALRSRPLIQRVLIRSWEYIPAARVAILGIRTAVVLWLVFLSAMLFVAHNPWAWTLIPAAAALAAISLWVFMTARKGWPVVKA